MTFGFFIRVLLWFTVLLIPMLTAGFPLPYGVFALVPALVAIDGLAPRRVAVWVALTLLFSFVYRVPVGVLSVPIVAVALLDAGIRRSIRLDGEVSRISDTTRRAIQCVLWIVALVVCAALFEYVLYNAPFSFSQIAALWYRLSTGGVIALGAALFFAVLNRFPRRAPELRAW
jgi:hypothetical protein